MPPHLNTAKAWVSPCRPSVTSTTGTQMRNMAKLAAVIAALFIFSVAAQATTVSGYVHFRIDVVDFSLTLGSDFLIYVLRAESCHWKTFAPIIPAKRSARLAVRKDSYVGLIYRNGTTDED